MAKNAKVLIIRHAERPDSGTDLAVAGQERAQAYVVYFQNYGINSKTVKLNYLFAAADSNDSHRPRLTIEPLSKVIGVSIDANHKDREYKSVAEDILVNSKYDNSNILICWHHEEILDLAVALGVVSTDLPASAKWPTVKWPGSVFGWLLQISYDANGKIIPTQTLCASEKLMYNDYGQNPPNA